MFTEPLAAACGILERTSITSETRVAVIGDGKLGLLCAQVIATTGAPVILIGKHQSKLQIAARHGIESPRVGVTIKQEVVVKKRTGESASSTLIRARVESLRNIFEKALEDKLRG